MRNARLVQNLSVRLAVALAFADASIVVLALPQLLDRLHTSIDHVVWVIVAYNVALIAGCAVMLLIGRRVPANRSLVAGLVLFGLSSIGCGLAGSLAVLIPFRVLQGLGGALVLCASLPMFAAAARPGDSPLYGWSAAAAIGAAVGPAAGGVLTQLFSWRSIFFAQAPVAAVAVGAVLVATSHASAETVPASDAEPRVPGGERLAANAALTLLAAGLIGALFLIVIEMINGWLLSPIAAAAVVLTIPLATTVAERAVRGFPPEVLGAVGALLVAGGLFLLSELTHEQLGLVVLALALCGTGLGLGFPGLTTLALRGGGAAIARAAFTVGARDAGLVLGLLVLTPIFVNRLDTAPNQATGAATGVVLFAPLPLAVKAELGQKLTAVVTRAPQSRPPDFTPVFRRISAQVPPQQRPALARLKRQLDAIVQRAVTSAFKRPFQIAALFAVCVLPLLGLGIALTRRRPA
ncbi:MAG TPA: MFS transporter [Solirubrobacteraceae bacterium]|nr:MFS transporter [Solirubrobacteraceae bacterium]